MSDLATIADLISEQTNVNVEQAFQIDGLGVEMARTNENIESMLGFLTADIEDRREQRREERDAENDRRLSAKAARRDDKAQTPPRRRSRGLNPLGILAGLAGISTGALGGLMGILARWEQKKDDLDKSIQGALTKLNGIIAAPVVMNFLGGLKNMSANVAKSFMRMFTVFSDFVKTEVAILKAGGGKFRQPFLAIGKTIGAAFKFLSGVGKSAIKVFNFAMKFAKPFLKVLGLIGGILGRVSGIFTLAIALFDGLRGVWKEWESGVRNPIRLLRVFLESAITGFLSLIGDVGEVFGWLAEKFLKMLGVSDETAAKIRSYIVKTFDFIERVLVGIVHIMGNVFEWIGNKAYAFGQALFPMFARIPEFIATVITKFKGLVTAVTTTIGNVFNVVTETFEKIKGFYAAVWGKITGAKDKMVEEGKAFVVNIGVMMDKVRDAMKKVREGLRNALSWVRNKLNGAKDALLGRDPDEQLPKIPSIQGGEGMVAPRTSGRISSSDKLSSAGQTIRVAERAASMVVAAPRISQSTSNVAVSSNSQILSIPPASMNRTDPFATGIR